MKKPGNKAYKIMVLIFLFLLLMITAGCTHKEEAEVIPEVQDKTESNDNNTSTETGADDNKNNTNKVVVAETRTLDKYLYFNADIFYDDSKDLYFKLNNCKLKGLYVENDDQVEEGQLLAELDTADLEYQISKKQLDLDKLYLQYDNILNNTQAAEDNSTALEILELEIEAINIDISHLEEQISKAKLVAPYTGIVRDVRKIEPGTMVRAYDKFMTVWNTKSVILESEILNPYGSSIKQNLANITTGMEVEILFGGKTNQITIPATVSKIINTDNGLESDKDRFLSEPIPFKLVIIPDGKDADKLSEGRTVVFRIKTGTYDNAVVLPTRAIIGSGEDTMIKVMKGEKIINRRVVTDYVDRESNVVVISSGLLTGERVLLK